MKPLAFRGVEIVVGPDLTLLPLVRTGAFEDRELDWLLPRIPAGAEVWDIGANVGIYTVLMAKAATSGHVVAFEPSAPPLALLRENLARNDVGNVAVVEAGVSDHEGSAVLFQRSDTAGGSSLEQSDGPFSPVQVRLVTGDGFVQAGGAPPSVIKIDVEGHEPSVIAGCWNLIKQHKPLIILEVNAGTFVHDEARLAVWRETLTDLFGVYGSATWFGPKGLEHVTQVDLASLGTARPYSLGFETPSGR
jgi:FkbM family methyltransferase